MIRHNAFSAKYLSLVSASAELGLFRTIAPWRVAASRLPALAKAFRAHPGEIGFVCTVAKSPGDADLPIGRVAAELGLFVQSAIGNPKSAIEELGLFVQRARRRPSGNADLLIGIVSGNWLCLHAATSAKLALFVRQSHDRQLTTGYRPLPFRRPRPSVIRPRLLCVSASRREEPSPSIVNHPPPHTAAPRIWYKNHLSMSTENPKQNVRVAYFINPCLVRTNKKRPDHVGQPPSADGSCHSLCRACPRPDRGRESKFSATEEIVDPPSQIVNSGTFYSRPFDNWELPTVT